MESRLHVLQLYYNERLDAIIKFPESVQVLVVSLGFDTSAQIQKN